MSTTPGLPKVRVMAYWLPIDAVWLGLQESHGGHTIRHLVSALGLMAVRCDTCRVDVPLEEIDQSW